MVLRVRLDESYDTQSGRGFGLGGEKAGACFVMAVDKNSAAHTHE